MSASREILESHLEDYQQKLKSLNSYIRELNARTAEYGTDKTHFEGDLLEAEHNIAYYESEVARLKGELRGGGGGGRAPEGGAEEERGILGSVLPQALMNQSVGTLVLSSICFAAGVLVGSRLLAGRRED
jgi:hypothetical protein